MTRIVVTGSGVAVTGIADAHHLLDPGHVGDPETDAARRAPGTRHKDRASRIALRATRRALREAGHPGAGTAVIVSSNFGNLDTVCDFVDTIAKETVTGISPIRVPHMSGNVTACRLAIEHGLRGPNITLCSGTASGLDAVAWAGVLLAAGRAEAVVVVGVEPDTPPVARLHGQHGQHGQHDGIRHVDGGACLVLETADHARARNATPLAEIAGLGRAPESTEAVRRATASWTGPIGLHLMHGGGSAVDLTARLGRCSGALGVLQCAAALAWLERPGHDAVLAVAGGDDDEGDPGATAAALLTRPSGGARAAHA